MGGGAFSNARADGQPTLKTPRILPSDYLRLWEEFNHCLSNYFGPDNIISPTPVPEKADYGDIDIYISHIGIIDWAEVATLIGATAYLDRGSEKSQKCSFAVRLNGQPTRDVPICYTICNPSDQLKGKPSPNLSKEEYVQLDLEKVPPELQLWTQFYNSYGDLAGILGNGVTNFGFDMTDRGLRLRLQELDDCGCGEWENVQIPLEEGRMMLSGDPREVMEFFGLDLKRYDAGFKTELQIFEWLAQCRMISKYSLRRERDENSRERHKVGRPMFTRFFKEWLPKHMAEETSEEESYEMQEVTNTEGSSPISARPSDEPNKVAGTTVATQPPNPGPAAADVEIDVSLLRQYRAKYLADALTFFNKSVQYDGLLQHLLRKRGNLTAAHIFRSIIATHTQKKGPKLAELVRSFRRNVAFRNEGPIILKEANEDEDSELFTFLDEDGKALRDDETVVQWIQDHAEVVKQVERQRAKESSGGGKAEAG